MKSRHKIQYTIRDVPAAVDRALRQKAERAHRSLNDVALEAFAKEAGEFHTTVEHGDLDHFFGKWVEDPETEQALEDQRGIEPAIWQAVEPKGK